MTDNYRPRIEIEAELPKEAGEMGKRIFEAINEMEDLPTDWKNCDYPADLVPFLSVMQESPGRMECIPQYHEDGSFTVVCENEYREYDVTLVMHEIMKAYKINGVARIEYSDHVSGGVFVASATGHDGIDTALMMQTCERRLSGEQIAIKDVSSVQHAVIIASLRLMQSALDDGTVSNDLLSILSSADPDVSVTPADIDHLIEQHVN